jgi:nanoRNase/pAp phosphatase (c-di-AMP/oligoRNAs hydrolase)
VNVNEIAALFGGGGHKAGRRRACGRQSAVAVQRRVLGAVKRALAGRPIS